MVVKNLVGVLVHFLPEQLMAIESYAAEREKMGITCSRNKAIRELVEKGLKDRQIDLETAIRYSQKKRERL